METINIDDLPLPASRIELGTWAIGGWMWGGSDEALQSTRSTPRSTGGPIVALWGARRPDQVTPVSEAMGWSLDDATMRDIDGILAGTIKDPVGPEFMAPPVRSRAATPTAAGTLQKSNLQVRFSSGAKP